MHTTPDDAQRRCAPDAPCGRRAPDASRRRVAAALGAGLATLAGLPGAARAQAAADTFPNRPIRLIMPFSRMPVGLAVRPKIAVAMVSAQGEQALGQVEGEDGRFLEIEGPRLLAARRGDLHYEARGRLQGSLDGERAGAGVE